MATKPSTATQLRRARLELARYKRHAENLQRSLNVAHCEQQKLLSREQLLAWRLRLAQDEERRRAAAQARAIAYDARFGRLRDIARALWERACLAAGRIRKWP